jgi:hypothetical protein
MTTASYVYRATLTAERDVQRDRVTLTISCMYRFGPDKNVFRRSSPDSCLKDRVVSYSHKCNAPAGTRVREV